MARKRLNTERIVEAAAELITEKGFDQFFIHFSRAIRSAMHGFVTLEGAGFWNIPAADRIRKYLPFYSLFLGA